ncbi:DUF6161 domain-containing protein [Aeromonas veronii]|uniref:DUF6161 domain-containing protein n=1 Tax=Aeromonas veronii TaxID=654 RepID=UPI003670B577
MMSEQSIDTKISVPLGNGRGEKVFSSIDQYNDFIRGEREFWKWTDRRFDYPLNHLQDFVRSYCINNLLIEINDGNAKSQWDILVNRQHQWLPIYSFTPEGEFVKSLESEYGHIIAMFALIHITDLTHNGLSTECQRNSHCAEMMKIFSTQNSFAVSLVLSFGNKLCINQVSSYISSVENSHRQFMSTLESVEKDLSQSVEDYSNKLSEIVNKHELLHKKTKEKIKRWSYRCLSGINKTRVFAKKTFDESKLDISQAAAAYHEQIDLDASVTYWNSKKTRNNRKAFIWFVFGIGGSVGATFYLLAKYYAKGGIIGISAKLADVGEAGTAGVNKLQSVTPVISSGMEHLVFNTTGAALVVTLMAVIIRVALRQFNTYSHLSLEAEERVTMVKTYLALLNEGKLKSDQDRHLALEALFRTSQTGMIAETSFNSPVDIIVKSLADKAKV